MLLAGDELVTNSTRGGISIGGGRLVDIGLRLCGL